MLGIQQVVGDKTNRRSTTEHARAVDHVSSEEIRKELLLVLLLGTNTHLLDQHSGIPLQEPSDRPTNRSGRVKHVRKVVGHVHFNRVHIADKAVTDRVTHTRLASERLLREASDTEEKRLGNRGQDEVACRHRRIHLIQLEDSPANAEIRQVRSITRVRVGSRTPDRLAVTDIRLPGRRAKHVTSSRIFDTRTSRTGDRSTRTQLEEDIPINALGNRVSSVVRIEPTQGRKCLHINDVLDKPRVFLVLIDGNRNTTNTTLVNERLQRHDRLRDLVHGGAASRGRDVDRIALLTAMIEFTNQVREYQIRLVDSNTSGPTLSLLGLDYIFNKRNF